MFLCKGRWNHPHQVGHFSFSVHPYILAKRIINQPFNTDRASPHSPFSRASQATFKPAFSISPAGRNFTDERRLQGWQQDVHSLPEPYQQDISAVDERRKEEAIFPSSATMISAGFSSNVRRRVLQIPLHDKPLPLGLCLNTDNAVILLVRARFARPK